MIQWVYEQAQKSHSLDEVIVATDDIRISKAVEAFGGKVMVTQNEHANGTSRCAEVAKQLSTDYVVNIQGDEPYLEPEQIDALTSILDGQVEIGTLVHRIHDTGKLLSPNTAKVVLDKYGNARYFSRQPIPHVRDLEVEQWIETYTFWQHVGIYAYRTDILQKIVTLPPGNLEIAESLEQLRWLENGYSIRCAETQYEPFGIDTLEDLKKAQG
ncbi:kdsB [Symbiodinium microadriaticum]|nr:kdsB [Symbiodinium microadriaticum]